MRKGKLLCGAALGVALSMGAGAAAQAQDLGVSWKGAPEFTNDDAQFKVRGRILLDYVHEDIDRAVGADSEASNLRGRQVFLGVEGRINSYFAYKAEGGAVNGGAWAWDDVVIEYKPNDFTSIMVGNLKVVSLENMTSTRFTSFMDRGPYADLTDASYALGLVARLNGQNWTFTGGVLGDSLNAADVTGPAPGTGRTEANERMQLAVRATYAPIDTDTDKLHLGLWARYRDSNSEGFVYQLRPNTNYGSRFIGTGAQAYGDADFTVAGEFAFVHSNLSLQAEYANISVDAIDGLATPLANRRSDADFTTGYVFASWFPTGEMRQYDPRKGEFGRQKVLNPVTAGGTGALELLLRYDWADLTEARTGAGGFLNQAGEYTGWTLGATYYPFSYVRVMANYTQSQNDSPGVVQDVDTNVFQMRAQVDF
ncbi:MAG: OprO/OprP family phosphate-selective porin [Caulobacteraceae bacterium]|nr:OprO/OprP family phosphate-selective porin [Caulobacteraceae bacterium]